MRRSSKIVLLSARPGVLVHVPLNITILVLESATPDLKQSHGHPGANLGQLDTLVTSLDKDVMSDLNAVIDILEGDDSATKIGAGLSGGKQVLQNLDYSLTQFCGETLKDQVWVALADCATGSVRDVLSQDDVVQREACGGTVGEMRDGHCSRRTTVFVEKDNVGEPRGFGRTNEIGQN